MDKKIAKLYIGGKIATIDEDDMILVEKEIKSLQIWQGYIYIITKEGKKEPLHRFLLKKHDVNIDGLVVHHKDGNGLNNCISNLDAITLQENALGKKGSSKTSKFKGVRLKRIKSGNRYFAEISPNKKTIFLGTYLSEEDAAIAYDLASVKFFGKHLSILNFPEQDWSSVTTLEDWKREKALNGSFGKDKPSSSDRISFGDEDVYQPEEPEKPEPEVKPRVKRVEPKVKPSASYATNGISKIVSVTELTKMLGMSRSQFYLHANRGIFRKPLYLENKRPYFTPSMIEDNLKARETGIGVNGKYVIFYDRKKA